MTKLMCMSVLLGHQSHFHTVERMHGTKMWRMLGVSSARRLSSDQISGPVRSGLESKSESTDAITVQVFLTKRSAFEE